MRQDMTIEEVMEYQGRLYYMPRKVIKEKSDQLLEFAGGFTGDAYTKNVRLIRKAGQEYSIHTIE